MKRITLIFSMIICFILSAAVPLQARAGEVYPEKWLSLPEQEQSVFDRSIYEATWYDGRMSATYPTITLGTKGTTPAREIRQLFTICYDVNAMLASEGFDITFLRYSIVTDSEGEVHQCNIRVDMQAYNSEDFSLDDRSTIMGVAMETIVSDRYSISSTTRNKFYDELCKLDKSTAEYASQLSSYTNKDFIEAYSYFKPFTGVLGWILGFFAIGLFLCLTFSIILDITYISIPAFQSVVLAEIEASGRRRWVSREAYNAVTEAESKTGTEYVNPMLLFLRKRVRYYVAIAICLLYLCSGEIFSIIASAIDYFRGIM